MNPAVMKKLQVAADVEPSFLSYVHGLLLDEVSAASVAINAEAADKAEQWWSA
jgi:hypothetical protein